MADALEQRGQRRCSLVDEGLLVTVEHFIAHGRDHGICLALAAGAQPPARPEAGTASETETDAKAAARILEARKKSTEDIVAGRPAPYYLATPTTPAPSRPNPARASKDDDGSAKR